MAGAGGGQPAGSEPEGAATAGHGPQVQHIMPGMVYDKLSCALGMLGCVNMAAGSGASPEDVHQEALRWDVSHACTCIHDQCHLVCFKMLQLRPNQLQHAVHPYLAGPCAQPGQAAQCVALVLGRHTAIALQQM